MAGDKERARMDRDTERIAWVDIAKAFAVYLCIVGHVAVFEGELYHLIFSFHMPAFIILSGYTMKASSSFTVFLKKRIRSIILPYLVFNLLGILITLIFPCAHYRREDLFSAAEWLKSIIRVAGGGVLTGHLGAVWFLPALFTGSLIAYWILRLIRAEKLCIKISGFLLLALLFLAAVNYALFDIPFSIPWRIDNGLMFAFFLVCGYLLKEYRLLEERPLWLTGILALVFFVLWYFKGLRNVHVNLAGHSYGSPVNFLIGAFGGTFCLIFLSQIIARLLKALSGLFCFVGRNTLIIFALQIYPVKQCVYIYNQIFGTELESQHIEGYLLPLVIGGISLVVLCFLSFAYEKIWQKLRCLRKARSVSAGTDKAR